MSGFDVIIDFVACIFLLWLVVDELKGNKKNGNFKERFFDE